jgi:protein-S-isoprenylcysteine O-methyltransferase Ste14
MLATIMIAQLGLVLAIPSLFTLICLVVGVATLLRQAQLEEMDMARRHGEAWSAYLAARRAWPWSPPARRR